MRERTRRRLGGDHGRGYVRSTLNLFWDRPGAAALEESMLSDEDRSSLLRGQIGTKVTPADRQHKMNDISPGPEDLDRLVRISRLERPMHYTHYYTLSKERFVSERCERNKLQRALSADRLYKSRRFRIAGNRFAQSANGSQLG